MERGSRINKFRIYKIHTFFFFLQTFGFGLIMDIMNLQTSRLAHNVTPKDFWLFRPIRSVLIVF